MTHMLVDGKILCSRTVFQSHINCPFPDERGQEGSRYGQISFDMLSLIRGRKATGDGVKG